MTHPPGPPPFSPPSAAAPQTSPDRAAGAGNAFHPAFGQGPPGPLYLPAGPPGASYADGDRTPTALLWFRLYAGLLSLQFLSLAVFGITGAVTAGFKGGTPEPADIGLGIGLTVLGFALATPHVIVLFGGRRPWVHSMGTVLLALGIIGGGCCALPAIALLVTWTKPETKRWFDESSKGGAV